MVSAEIPVEKVRGITAAGADQFAGEALSRSFCGEAGADCRSGCEGASPANPAYIVMPGQPGMTESQRRA